MTLLQTQKSCLVYERVKVNKWIYIALYHKPFLSKPLRFGLCATMWSHSITCHPHTNHTCLYSPATKHHRPGTHCAYPQRDGQAELTWVAGHIPRQMSTEPNQDTVTYPSTNQAWRRLSSLIETNVVLLCQITRLAHRAVCLFTPQHLLVLAHLPMEEWPGQVDLGVWLNTKTVQMLIEARNITHPSTNPT